MKKIQYLTMFALSVALVIIFNNKRSVYKIEGTINAKFLSKIIAIDERKAKIVVSSNGGLVSIGRKVANIILDKEYVIIIDDECFSSCAEHLLPAAKSVVFRNKPLIGYHQNAIMIAELVKENAEYDIAYCNFYEANEQRKLYENKKLNSKFWQETLKRIELEKINFVYEYAACPGYDVEFKNKIWLPTSKQLRELLKLKFKGEVCADDPVCVKSKLSARWVPGSRIVVGDRVVVVE